MKTIDKIPSSKIGRATSIVKTGLKVGANYASYYGEKLINSDITKEKLDENNAKDIYNGLTELKGSALKVAQMLSMEKNVIPQAYAKEFAQAQFSVPPLSPALVKKTFKRYMGQNPEDLFDSFKYEATKGASMGQVHEATKDGKKLAIKIQYPGVAESISSDLALVKPFAIKMFNLKGKDSEKFFQEVESKLIEETDYELEVKRSIDITKACSELDNLAFPIYHTESSSSKIITMSWLEGLQLSEFLEKENDQETLNMLGQSLWDFYMYQMHQLRMVHADPHPGNFLVTPDNKLGVIDFGCIKIIPEEFYEPYFALTQKEQIQNPEKLEQSLRALEVIRDDDTDVEQQFFTKLFSELLSMLALPFQSETFDFSSKNFLDDIAKLGEKYADMPELRKFNGNRGSEHLLYINRTFFGLYNLLYDLKAEINTQKYI